VANEWEPRSLLEILADPRVQQIIASLNTSGQSVSQLVDACSGSESSIYRRLKVLEEVDLVSSEPRVDSNGDHYSVYQTNCTEFRIKIAENGLHIEGIESDFREKIRLESPENDG